MKAKAPPSKSLSLSAPPSPKAFNNWMDNTMDDLQDTFVCSSIEEVDQLQIDLEEFKAGPLQDASGNYDELNSLVTTMAELGSTDNPYTTLTPTVSLSLWTEVWLGLYCCCVCSSVAGV